MIAQLATPSVVQTVNPMGPARSPLSDTPPDFAGLLPSAEPDGVSATPNARAGTSPESATAPSVAVSPALAGLDAAFGKDGPSDHLAPVSPSELETSPQSTAFESAPTAQGAFPAIAQGEAEQDAPTQDTVPSIDTEQAASPSQTDEIDPKTADVTEPETSDAMPAEQPAAIVPPQQAQTLQVQPAQETEPPRAAKVPMTRNTATKDTALAKAGAVQMTQSGPQPPNSAPELMPLPALQDMAGGKAMPASSDLPLTEQTSFASALAASAPVNTTATSVSLAPANPTFSMQQQNWPAALVAGPVVTLLDLSGSSMVLDLAPEELGRMTVTLTLQGDAMSVRFQTENPDAARLLQEAERQLASEVQRLGMTLAGHEANTDRRQSSGRSARHVQREAFTETAPVILAATQAGRINLIA